MSRSSFVIFLGVLLFGLQDSRYGAPLRGFVGVEAFLFLYSIAITVHALVERQVRAAMKARGLQSIPLYPEQRSCRAPTADKILGLFQPVRRHRLFRNGRRVKTFWDELTDVQRLVLDLLDVPTSAFGQ